MKYIYTISFLAVLLFVSIPAKGKETITFKSSDGLEITADLYLAHDLTKPFIILFHQAGWSRGEYLGIAPKLNELGFNCMAVDQRAGGSINEVTNETNKRAKEQNKKTRWIDALADMQAAVDYVNKNYAKGKLIVWGSSYSSALVIPLASENQNIVDGSLSFSPGEYFTEQGKSETFVTDAAKKLTIPVFITSAKNEKEQWAKIFEAIPSKTKTSFLPSTDGNHGAKALWSYFGDSKDYWTAVNNFLKKNFLSD